MKTLTIISMEQIKHGLIDNLFFWLANPEKEVLIALKSLKKKKTKGSTIVLKNCKASINTITFGGEE